MPLSSGIPIVSCVFVSEKLVYCSCFLALCWLACFFNTHFMPPFALRVATAPIPMREVMWLDWNTGEYRYSSWTKQLLKNNWTYSVTFTVVILHKHPLTLLLLEKTANVHLCLLATPTKSHPHKFNYFDLFFAMLSALAKFAKVKFTQNIIALRYTRSITMCLGLAYLISRYESIWKGMTLQAGPWVGL